MKKLVGIAALALSLGSAQAADLPRSPDLLTKATAGYPTGCGIYFGIGTVGTAAPVKDAGVGVSVIGGSIDADIGYSCPIGNTPGSFWFIEGIAGAQNLNGSTNGLGLTGPIHLEQRVGVGGPLLAFIPTIIPGFGNFSTPSLPLLPAGVTQGTAYPYMYAALNEDDISASFGLASNREWLVAPEVGMGFKTRLSNNVVADVWGGAKLESNSMCLGPGGSAMCPRLGMGAVAGVKFDY